MFTQTVLEHFQSDFITFSTVVLTKGVIQNLSEFNYISICLSLCVCVSSTVSGVKDIFKVTHREQAKKPTQELNNRPQWSYKRPQMCSGHYGHKRQAFRSVSYVSKFYFVVAKRSL